MQTGTNAEKLPVLPDIAARLGRRLPLAPFTWVANPLLNRIFAGALADGELDFLAGRELALCVEDTGLVLAFRLEGGHLVCARPRSPDVTIAGPAAAFVMLASKQTDADTLFFQRVLVMKGDTELGLGVKYLLEAMPLDALPPPLHATLQWLAARLAGQSPFAASMPGAPRQ